METRFLVRPWAVAVVLLLFLPFLPACGGGSESGVSGGGTSSPQAAAAGRVADSSAEFAVAESEMAESAAAQDQGVPQGFGRKIVKTADLDLRAENVRAAEARRVAARFGGSVLSSETYRADGSVSADLVLSVPSPEFEAALDELRRLGEEVTTDSVRGRGCDRGVR